MMEKGTYYVGDLCYVLDNNWDEVCNLLFPPNYKGDHRANEGELELKRGIKFAIYGTAWSDGCYADNFGNEYGVDAGVIGCIKIDDLAKLGENISDLGTIHEFSEDFETSYQEGVITFGHIKINTDMSFEEEDVPEFCYCSAQGGARCVCEEEEDT